MSLLDLWQKPKAPAVTDARQVVRAGLNRRIHDLETRADHRERNRRKLAAESRAYYNRNHDKVLDRIRTRRAANKDYRDTNRRYYIRNRSRINADRRTRRIYELAVASIRLPAVGQKILAALTAWGEMDISALSRKIKEAENSAYRAIERSGPEISRRRFNGKIQYSISAPVPSADFRLSRREG